jgi:hypothetical protein
LFDSSGKFASTYLVGEGELIEELTQIEIGEDSKTYRNSAFCDSAMVFGTNEGKVVYFSTVPESENDEVKRIVTLKYQQGNESYWVDGVEKKMDAPAINKWGRMFLPVRFVGADIGMKISWDGKERKVTLASPDGSRVVELWIGKNESIVTVDGKRKNVKIDAINPEVVPVIESGRTYLPLRFCGDSFGAKEILYDAATKVATLIYEINW